MTAADLMKELTDRGKASAAISNAPGAALARRPAHAQSQAHVHAPEPEDPEALERLLEVDFVDYAGYHVGAQVIPKGHPADRHLKEFQRAQRAIGGTPSQLEVLKGVREGRLPSESLPETHLSAAQFLKCATFDKSGDMHVGNVTIGKNLVGSFTQMLNAEGMRDPQLVAHAVKLALAEPPQRMDVDSP